VSTGRRDIAVGDPVTDEALRAAIRAGRTVAAKAGTMHGSWDAIFDGEALLEGKPTLLRFETREEGVRVIYNLLKGNLPKEEQPHG
jgi:hypothetical protein